MVPSRSDIDYNEPMKRKTTTIAQEIENRMWYLADPAVRWVPRHPNVGESCLLYDALVTGGVALSTQALSYSATNWLDEFIHDVEGVWATTFNDRRARSRDDVIERLEEAVDQARWEGV